MGGVGAWTGSLSLVGVLLLPACGDGHVRESDRATCNASLDVMKLGISKAPEAVAKAKSIAPLLDTIQRKDLAESATDLVAVASTVGVNASGSWRSNSDFMAFSGAALDLSKLCARYYP